MPSGRRPGRQHQNASRARLIRNRNVGGISLNTENLQLPNVTKVESTNEQVTVFPVCHPAIPDLQPLGSLAFEMLLLLYLHTALFCQYIYLYKTVWWYPVALPPSTTSLSFHLIDRNLTLFLAVFLSRRLIWALLWDFLRPRSDNAPGVMLWFLVCFFVGILWVCFLVGPLICLYYSTSLLNMLVLCYPMFLWLPLAGLSGDSSPNLVVAWMNMPDSNSSVSLATQEHGQPGSPTFVNEKQPCNRTRLLDNAENAADLKMSYANLGNAVDARQIREEVRLLCRDFNSRISEIVFCSMVCAYYVGLVPMFFMKSHQYYDILWCLQHTVLVLLNSFMLLSSQLFNPRYLHVLHKCASLLGGYKMELDSDFSEDIDLAEDDNVNLEENEVPCTEDCVYEWSSCTAFTSGRRVRYEGNVYTAVGKHNVAEPGDVTHARFYFMFSSPLRIMNWSVIAHSIIVLFQIHLLVSSSEWDRLISIALLQFFSYYVLFRTLRDRIILEKAYGLHDRKECYGT